MKYLVAMLFTLPLSALAVAPDLKLGEYYSVQLSENSPELPISRAEFDLLRALRSRNSTALTKEVVARRTGVEDVDELIQSLNLNAAKILGTPLVAISSKGEIALVGEVQETQGVKFALHETGKGIIYRGEVVDLTPRQLDLVRALWEKPNHRASYDEIEQSMEWTAPRRRDAVADINRRTLAATGARLIDIYKHRALAIKLVDRPVRTLAERAQVAKENLDLSQRTYEVPVDEVTFIRMGLSVQEIREALAQLTWPSGSEIETFRVTIGNKVLRVHVQRDGRDYGWRVKQGRRCGQLLQVI